MPAPPPPKDGIWLPDDDCVRAELAGGTQAPLDATPTHAVGGEPSTR
jgi:hypothetical protein